MKPEYSQSRSRIRVLAAIVGGSAVVAMGAATLSLGGDGGVGTIVSEPGTYTQPTPTEMTTGETTKSSTLEATETVSPPSASPPVTAEPAPTAD
jgi:hypothetical protein